MRFIRPAVAIRWLLAGLLVGGGVYSLARVLATETNWVAAFARSLFSMSSMISGVLLASPELVGWAVQPVHRLIDSIFLPSESAPPPANYALARHYTHQLRHEEARQEYEKIIHYHPEQFDACLEGIQAAARVNDEASVQRFYRAARQAARTETNRDLLERVYSARHALTYPTTDEGATPLPETSS